MLDHCLRLALAALLLLATARAQGLPDAPSAPLQNPAAGAPTLVQPHGPQSTPSISQPPDEKRVLGVIPAFGVTNEQNAPPLTPKQKFLLFLHNSIDPFTFVAVAFQAGISQVTDSFSSYGQGAAGYGKRYGAALLDSTDSSFFSDFAYPVLLKQDPRYFRLGHGTVQHRIGYALVQEFWAKTDHGTRRINWSSVLGAFTTGAISNAYYPDRDRGFRLTMSRSAISLGFGMAGGIGKEFLPDIDRKLFHKNLAKDTDKGAKQGGK